jgi:sigma-E factor negative regulatory protein RseA
MNHSELPAGSDRAAMSALMDGELDESQVASLCTAWRTDRQCRADWHAYHLIGDVLRSEELANPASRDGEFMSRLRERLEREPVVLAPTRADAGQPAAQPTTATAAAVGAGARSTGDRGTGAVVAHARRRALLPSFRSRWATPVGVAAGVVMVAGAVWSTRGDPDGSASWWSPATVATAASAVGADERAALAEAEMARYLRAHREYSGSTTLSPAAGYLRNAAYDAGTR